MVVIKPPYSPNIVSLGSLIQIWKQLEISH